jgi:hypothetical protein
MASASFFSAVSPVARRRCEFLTAESLYKIELVLLSSIRAGQGERRARGLIALTGGGHRQIVAKSVAISVAVDRASDLAEIVSC